MDAATTESLFKYPAGCETMTVRLKSEAVVRDASVIEHVIMNWNVWEGSHKDIMELLFQALASLVRDDHPYQTFNIKQFQVVNLVSKIFKIYQVRKLCTLTHKVPPTICSRHQFQMLLFQK